MDISTGQIYWYDYPIFFVYNIVFTYLLYRISPIMMMPRITVRNFIVLYQILFLIIFLHCLFDFIPPNVESSYYEYMLQSNLYPQDAAYNLMGVYYFTIVAKIICLNSIIIYALLCNFLFFIGVILLVNVLSKQYGASAAAINFFSYMLLFYPALYFSLTTLSRVPLVVFSFSIFLTGVFSFKEKGKWIPLLAGSILLASLNLKLLPFILFLLLAVCMKKWKIHRAFQAGVIIALCIVSVILLKLMEIKTDAPSLAAYRNEVLETPIELVYGFVHWQTYSGMVRDEVFIALQFILSPLPVFSSVNIFSYPLLLADIIFILLTLSTILINIKETKQFYFLFFVIFLFILFYGSQEISLMKAVENRIPVVLLLLYISATFLSSKEMNKQFNA